MRWQKQTNIVAPADKASEFITDLYVGCTGIIKAPICDLNIRRAIVV
jgi:hypothetical protein